MTSSIKALKDLKHDIKRLKSLGKKLYLPMDVLILFMWTCALFISSKTTWRSVGSGYK